MKWKVVIFQLTVWALCVAWGQPEVVSSPHPMLFFSHRDVASLRLKARTTHKAIAERIVEAMELVKAKPATYLPPIEHEEFISKWNEEYGNNLCTLAMYCVLYPDDTAALTLVHQFMERMTNHPSWEFGAMTKDEMPISHSLTGMATAYDFLYPTLSIDQRQRYFERIRKTTSRHFERFTVSSWGKWHLQNHVWNNNIGLLIGAVVTSVHDSQAEQWVDFVASHLNISMTLFNLIVDGSIGEGVSYSTYSTRAMTMFVHIMDRRYGVQLYNNYWMEQYFWMMYRTLIGYQETVGIGDSNPTWFYGPESMLVFLDRFILRNGYGNWLAARIRENRCQGAPLTDIRIASVSQRWSTYHTEFIWYDDTLGENDPDPEHLPTLSLFPDWGVVTYGGGLPPNNTFFSFKSGYTHGRAINTIIKQKTLYQGYVRGWASFNAGHEHPDQNSFTFWPRGQPFITEAYYGPKISFLDNILLFAPSREAHCFPPYEGQVGECYKWLDYNDKDMTWTNADVVASSEREGFVFVSGEAMGSYKEHLKLASVYRSVLLLSPDVLLVMDHIALKAGSKVKRASAVFNMRQGELELLSASQEAVLKHSGQDFHVIWNAAGRATPGASVAAYEYPCEFKTRQTQLLNISVELWRDKPTHVAYVFYHGSSPQPSHPQFSESSNLGFNLKVSIGSVTYDISVATEHTNPQARVDFLRHTGFATLSASTGQSVTFGYESTNPVPVLPTVLVTSLPWSGGEIVANTLNKSSDFALTSLTQLSVLNRYRGQFSSDEPCLQKTGKSSEFPKWLHDLYAIPYSSMSELPLKLPKSFSTKPNARVVMVAEDGKMDAKVALLPHKSTWVIHVVRDPRAWVGDILEHKRYSQVWADIHWGFKPPVCPIGETSLMSAPYKRLAELVNRYQDGETLDQIEVLSLYWVAHVMSVLQSGIDEDRLLTVWLEDLVLEPERTAEKIFGEFLGMPFPPASRHHVLQYTRSKALQLSSGEIIDHRNIERWKKVLTTKDIDAIERIVGEYTPETARL